MSIEVTPQGPVQAGAVRKKAATRRRRLVTVGIVALQVVTVLGVVAWWWRGTSSGSLAPYVFGSPDRIGRYFAENFGQMFVDLGTTVVALLLGCFVGVLFGVTIGFLSGLVPKIGQIFDPLIVAFNAMPRKIFIPLFVLLLGLGVAARVWHVAFVVMFPVAISIAGAIQTVENELVDNYVVLGAGRVDLLRHVYLPGISTWLASSVRFTVGLGFQAVVLAEIITGTSGLGAQINRNQALSNVSGVWAVLLVFLVFSVMLDHVLRVVERRTLSWRSGQ